MVACGVFGNKRRNWCAGEISRPFDIKWHFHLRRTNCLVSSIHLKGNGRL